MFFALSKQRVYPAHCCNTADTHSTSTRLKSSNPSSSADGDRTEDSDLVLHFEPRTTTVREAALAGRPDVDTSAIVAAARADGRRIDFIVREIQARLLEEAKQQRT